MKKLVAALLALVIILLIPASSLAAQPVEPRVFPLADKSSLTHEELALHEKMYNQYNAVMLYNSLVTAFVERYGEMGGYPAAYPDSYAGAYLDDNGKLIIQVKALDEYLESKEAYNREYSAYIDINSLKDNDADFTSSSFDDVVEFAAAAYSLNELSEIMQLVTDSISEHYPIMRAYIDSLNNSVVVEISPLEFERVVYNQTDALTDALTESRLLSGNDIPVLFKIGEEITTHANHIGGQGYYFMGSGGGCTLGFTGWYNGSRIFVTCGHAVGTGGNYPKTYYQSVSTANEVGNVQSYQYKSGQAGDWAIVQLKSGETAPSKVLTNSGSADVSGRVNYVPVNTYLYTYGWSTKDFSFYQVSNLNVSGADSTTGMTQCVKIYGVNKTGGDSGGPYVISSGSGAYSAVGIETVKKSL